MVFAAAEFLEIGSPADAVPVLVLDAAGLTAWRESAAEAARRWCAASGFAARKGEVLCLPADTGGIGSVLAGLGEAGDAETPDPWLWAGIAEQLPAGRYRLPEGLERESTVLAAFGWAVAQYRFDRYVADEECAPRRLVLESPDTAGRARALAAATAMVRDLVNRPANDLGPAGLEEAAATLAAEYGADMSVITGDALLERNLPAIHAVGRAAAEAPRLIDLVRGEEGQPRLTLVGKGVCFDSGGLDLKSASGMRLMKKDMGGAAHALALARLVMEAELPVRLRVLIPAVENAVSAGAYRPGDVIATRKGLTVEIDNTDAEGRVVLADALALGDEESPDLMLDFATLTGAARTALGPDLPALFTADHALADALARAAARTGDPLWRLPLWQPYLEDLKSSVADIANASEGGFAGAITAALFLDRFVENARSWVHLDLYAWNRKARPGRPAGGEAMSLRAAFACLEERYGGRRTRG